MPFFFKHFVCIIFHKNKIELFVLDRKITFDDKLLKFKAQIKHTENAWYSSFRNLTVTSFLLSVHDFCCEQFYNKYFYPNNISFWWKLFYNQFTLIKYLRLITKILKISPFFKQIYSIQKSFPANKSFWS